MCIYTRRFPQFDACIMCGIKLLTDALLASHFTQLIITDVNCLGFNTEFHPNFFLGRREHTLLRVVRNYFRKHL